MCANPSLNKQYQAWEFIIIIITIIMIIVVTIITLTNSMAYETRKFSAAITRAL